MSEADLPYLRDLHPHERDKRIKFFEESHKYTIDGCELRESVTGFVHSFFPHFDADAVVAKMMSKPDWEKNKPEYAGMTAEQIKQSWRDNATKSADDGTYMHRQLELFYNKEPFADKVEVDPETGAEVSRTKFEDTKEYRMFQNFHQKHVVEAGLEPWRTEQIFWSEDLKLAGSCDFSCIDPKTGEIVLFDWKRCKRIEYHNRWQKGLPPVQHMDHCNISHYTLQLNTYKHMLERHYGQNVRRIKGMALVFLHPNQDDVIVEWVRDAQKEVQDMLRVRRTQGRECFADEDAELTKAAARAEAPGSDAPAPQQPPVIVLGPEEDEEANNKRKRGKGDEPAFVAALPCSINLDLE